MKSGELALAPAPLSVMIQKVPSAMCLMPEWPCSGWPLKGSDTPVGRPNDRPGTVPSFSTRTPVVYLPLTCRSCGAFLGAGTTLWAGSTAWPDSRASKAWGAAVLDCAAEGKAQRQAVTARMEAATELRARDIGKLITSRTEGPTVVLGHDVLMTAPAWREAGTAGA